MEEPQVLQIDTARPYRVHIGNGVLSQAGSLMRGVSGAKLACIVTDDNVAPLYGGKVVDSLVQSGFRTEMLVLPHGEKTKSLAYLGEIYAFLGEKQFTRSDMLVALGGGVVGDITGFAAATWLRGVHFTQLPTTLLAAVDSSVGGKTAINTGAGKNLVGAFWQPSAVICDTGTFETLPEQEFACGMAEVIKTACIKDSELFDLLAEQNATDHIGFVVKQCVKIKGRVVAGDEYDTGQRMLLNFGHTLGHAIEKRSDFSVPHGHAIAIGMVLISRAAANAGITPPGACHRLQACLKKHGLPIETGFTLPELLPLTLGDKKRAGGAITAVMLEDIGRGRLFPMQAEEFFKLMKGA